MIRAIALVLLFATPAAAQVEVVEESELPEGQVVERGYVRGEGRGLQYGAHLISPVYLTTIESPEGDEVFQGGGIGLWARIGWELPLGFTLEIIGGLAANGVDTRGIDTSNAFIRGDFGGGIRWMIFNDTAFVPFVQIGATARWFFFDWLLEDEMERQVSGEVSGAIHAAVGAQIELSPFFGIEFGLAVDYTFAVEIFAEGLVSLMPFAGVTLYLYDESGN